VKETSDQMIGTNDPVTRKKRSGDCHKRSGDWNKRLVNETSDHMIGTNDPINRTNALVFAKTRSDYLIRRSND
jgi:hypothetical protein